MNFVDRPMCQILSGSVFLGILSCAWLCQAQPSPSTTPVETPRPVLIGPGGHSFGPPTSDTSSKRAKSADGKENTREATTGQTSTVRAAGRAAGDVGNSPTVPTPDTVDVAVPEPAMARPIMLDQVNPSTRIPSISQAGYVDKRYRSEGGRSWSQSCSFCRQDCCDCLLAPAGDAVTTAFGRQIHNGSAAMMTIYAYDFFPIGGEREAQLTGRGRHQLQRIAERRRYTPAKIQIQQTGDPSLDQQRLLAVIEELGQYGISPDQVQLFRTHPGRTAAEAKVLGLKLLQDVEARGRTLQSSDSASSGSSAFSDQ